LALKNRNPSLLEGLHTLVEALEIGTRDATGTLVVVAPKNRTGDLEHLDRSGETMRRRVSIGLKERNKKKDKPDIIRLKLQRREETGRGKSLRSLHVAPPSGLNVACKKRIGQLRLKRKGGRRDDAP
jgi:hypothetical protein